MPTIRNSELIKRFTDFFRLKTNDMLGSEAGRMLVPVVTLPVPANIVQISDVIINSNDKTISVPSGKQWKLLYGFVVNTTTATAGNRRLRFIIQDASLNDLYAVNALNVQVASTTEVYNIGQFGDLGESFATSHTIPFPVNTILAENFSINITDIPDVDANDDMTIRLIVEETETTGE